MKRNHTIARQKEDIVKKWPLSFLLLCILFAACSLVLPTATYAEGMNLRLSPSVLQIHALPSSTVDGPFTIDNKSNDAITIKIGYKIINKDLSQEGIVTFLNDGVHMPGPDKSFFEKVQIVDENNTTIDSIQLGPLQQKKLKLRITLPANEPFSDYYFSLILLQDNSDNNSQSDSYINKKDQISVSTLQGGVALNTLVSVGQTETPTGAIYEFSTPFYQEQGPVAINLKIKNSGNHYMSPKGEIVIKNLLGQTVEKLDIPPTTVLAGTTRTMVDSVQITTGSKADPQITWPKKFLLGLYTVTARISLSNEGPFYTQTIRFVAFPLQFIISLILAAFFLLIVYLRLKKRSRRR